METIKAAIIKYTPDYFKLPYSLWSREAIQEFIKQKYGIEMPLTTITDYLRRWGMTCQRPAKRSTKQNEAAVKEFQEVTFPEKKDLKSAKKQNKNLDKMYSYHSPHLLPVLSNCEVLPR